MGKFFWPMCTDAFLANRRGNYADAIKLYEIAESVINNDVPDGMEVEGRQAFLSRLRSHLEVSKSAGNSSPTFYSQRQTCSHDNNKNDPKLLRKIEQLQSENSELAKRLRTMPSVDPLCISDPTFSMPTIKKEDFGIIVFGHTRLDTLEAVLESLKKQNAIKYTEVWLDGDQGNIKLFHQVAETVKLVKKYAVKHLHMQRGNFGFRKMLILGLVEMSKKYRDILVLEDDCFPVHDAVVEFRKELDFIRDDSKVFSVYGHHFLVESEKETCGRFQGWGWATTSEKLAPMLRQLIDCYSMTEERYLEFVNLMFTEEIKSRIEVTPPRLPSYTLKYFFAWDETLGLLTALNDQVHRPTKKRTIYNCGMGSGSVHFPAAEKWREPPFNLITPEEVWQYY